MRIVLALVLVMWSAQTATAQQVRQMLNGARAEAGLDGVTPSEQLEQAAMAHATDMARAGFFDHEGSDGSSVGQRAKRVGYGYCVIAENIAKGQNNVSEVFGDWLKSEGHRRNILNGQVREYGLVRAQDVWVLVLGATRC